MAIKGFDRETFSSTLHSLLSASQPIDDPQRLKSRDREVDDLIMALEAPGRHAFIYGDRGVGKSSLAQTVATLVQSSDNAPIITSCDSKSTMLGVIQTVIAQAEQSIRDESKESSISLKLPMFEYKTNTTRNVQYTQVNDMHSAVTALCQLSQSHSDKPVVVIDEFDTISSLEEREQFSTLLKHLGDRKAKVKLIFTGIGESLNDLLCGHVSSARQLHQEKLCVLPWDGRYDIIENAFETFNIKLPDDIQYKIAGLSDGFPSYVHLICEKILVECYRPDELIDTVDFPLFLRALNEAVRSVVETLRHDYDKATLGKPEHFYHILWAMADSADLIRNTEHIVHSYSGICDQLEIDALETKKFKTEFAKLRKETHGSIIVRGLGGRPGWFRFKENMVRGFVRMCAELNEVELDFDRNFTAGVQTAKASHKSRVYQPLTPTESRVERLRKNTRGK